MYNILLILAVLPVVLLCFFIYIKDVNKEPLGLLAKIFFLGFIMAFPVVIAEMIFDFVFIKDGVTNFILLFISVFMSVALIEEGAKFVVSKFIGYDDKEFDEIYDIIVYSVFASLGFACIENILYVFRFGAGVAVSRALLSVPGHMCFGVLMGYFLAMAKINSINNNKGLYVKNMIFALLVPTLVHTMYDTLLFYSENVNNGLYLILFFIFDINMVAVCFFTVSMVSRMQVVINAKPNIIQMNNISSTTEKQSSPNSSQTIQKTMYCPICGRYAGDDSYCGRCGYKLK